MMRGRLDEAFSCYERAVNPARAAGSGLLEAEAHYGMARIYIKRKDNKSARRALEQALANRTTWGQRQAKLRRPHRAHRKRAGRLIGFFNNFSGESKT